MTPNISHPSTLIQERNVNEDCGESNVTETGSHGSDTGAGRCTSETQPAVPENKDSEISEKRREDLERSKMKRGLKKTRRVRKRRLSKKNY